MTIHLSASQTRNAKFLISMGARMISYDKNDNSIIMDMTRRTPRALEEFNKMLDDGLTMDGSTITLDFSKIFVKGTEDSNIDEMMLIEEISSSPFKDTIDHPLIQTFLHDKFRRVKPFYIIFQLLPYLVFASKFSHCNLEFLIDNSSFTLSCLQCLLWNTICKSL